MPPSASPEARPVQALTDRGDEFNAHAFLVQTLMAKMQTATLVQVMAVRPGGTGLTGEVDVQPMVAQIDGAGNATVHGTIYGLPYSRIQGGASAIIMDPAVGDRGLAVFASRDISAVKATRRPNIPGSRRRFDMADGLYIGGFLNGAPTHFVQFTGGGINITTPGNVAITSASLTHNGVNIGATHLHSGVQTGAGQTGAPIP